MTIIDSHQHFWSLANKFTKWPTSDLAPIHRDFGPQDLASVLTPSGVEGTILVQAAPSLDETFFLLELARHASFVRGVIGWIDFEADDALEQLEAIAVDPLLKGVRPMLQDIDHPDWILNHKFDPIFEELIKRGLCFDALIRRDQIGQIIRLGLLHPQLKIAIDHAGKPNIAEEECAQWTSDLEVAGQVPSIHCKLSGLWTEAGDNISSERIAPYVRHIVQCFGARRVMWGSDWPVVELAGSYKDWLDQAKALLAAYSAQDQQAIFSATAKRFYNVN